MDREKFQRGQLERFVCGMEPLKFSVILSKVRQPRKIVDGASTLLKECVVCRGAPCTEGFRERSGVREEGGSDAKARR